MWNCCTNRCRLVLRRPGVSKSSSDEDGYGDQCAETKSHDTVTAPVAAPTPRSSAANCSSTSSSAALLPSVILAVFVGYAVIQREPDRGDTQQVWAVLTDLDSCAEWNPFIIESSGNVKVGGTLRNTMRDVIGDRVFTREARLFQDRIGWGMRLTQ